MDNKLITKISDFDIILEWRGCEIIEVLQSSEESPYLKKVAVHISELELDELIVKQSPNVWSLSFDNVYKIDNEVKGIIGIPTPQSLSVRMYKTRTEDNNIKFELDIRHPSFGILNQFNRKGPFVVVSDNGSILLEESVYKLKEFIKAGPEYGRYENNSVSDLVYRAKAKELARIAGSSIESWLEKEELFIPEALGIEMSGDLNSGLEIRPIAKGVKNAALNEKLARSKGKKSVIWDPSGSSRKRMIIEPDQRHSVEQLTESNCNISPDNIADFLDTPEAFLPDGFDLSEFSDRVKGLKIRVYDSRPYIHVRKEKLQWFPDVSINLEKPDGSDGKELPPNITPVEYAEKVKKASKEGKTNFIHDNSIIHFDPDTVNTINNLQAIAGPKMNKGMTGSQSYILDVYDNVNKLGFSIDDVESKINEVEVVRDIDNYDIPDSINAELYPYQVTGYNWLRTLDDRGHSGLLADDMGLGKTLQVISYLAALHEAERVCPSVAILPKTLIQNWFNEISKFYPKLRVAQYKGGAVSGASDFENVDLVLTTYDTLRRNQVDMAKVDWKVVICDEAQAIKNPTTGRTTAVKALKSESRIAMTGTPVENGLSEFWSIMDWVNPGLLGYRKEFRSNYEKPIVNATNDSERARYVASLQNKVLNYFLRRMKYEVLEGLASKSIHRLTAPLSAAQTIQYKNLIEEARNGGREAMLGCLQKLLKLCACPWSDDEVFMVDGSSDDIQKCPKLGMTLNIIESIHDKGEKVLIFVDRLSVQTLLQNVIWRRFGVRAELINGKITDGRQAIVDRFSDMDGFQVMILSPKVGGTGLNITSANHVIHYMRPWNPAIENQATDRVHRIGQEKEVHVYLPISTWQDGDNKSVEEVLDELIESKVQLATDVIIPSAKIKLDKEVMDRVFK